jgi:hypothetical protein
MILLPYCISLLSQVRQANKCNTPGQEKHAFEMTERSKTTENVVEVQCLPGQNIEQAMNEDIGVHLHKL